MAANIPTAFYGLFEQCRDGRGTQAVGTLKNAQPRFGTRARNSRPDLSKLNLTSCGDVYGDHLTLAGWLDLVHRSAGWMFRVAVESIFGVSTKAVTRLIVNPSISSNWPQCRMSYRLPESNTCYDILIENPRAKKRRLRGDARWPAAGTSEWSGSPFHS